MAKKKGFDLYRSYRRDMRRTSRRGALRSCWFPVAAAALLCVFAWLMLAGWNRHLERKLAKLQAWLDSPENISRYEEAVEKDLCLSDLTRDTGAVQALTDRLSDGPKVDGQVLGRIAAVDGKELKAAVSGYDGETGELYFRAESPAVIDAADYIRKLESLGLFREVAYTGYAFENGTYTLQLTCTLRTAGGEETRDAADN